MSKCYLLQLLLALFGLVITPLETSDFPIYSSTYSDKIYIKPTCQNMNGFTAVDKMLSFFQNKEYRIRPNYRTYPYKRTVKQFRSLHDTATFLYVPLYKSRGNSNEYPQHMLL